MLKKIISGGQTGADRAALDSAMEAGFPCGGVCPRNRQAEDGSIPASYPLTEMEGGYPERTEQNVIHSDGTVIFFENAAAGGTHLTFQCCISHAKPHLLIDIANQSLLEAGKAIATFIESHSIEELNVAGPRASECPSIYQFVREALAPIL